MKEIDTVSTPACVGFIMDGNRRWARAQNLPTLEGHRKGVDAVMAVGEVLKERQITHAVFYSFSTENWNRSEAEVAYLMKLFETFAKKVQEQADEKKVGIRIVGEVERFSAKLQKLIAQVEEVTAKYTDATLWFARWYGCRDEIVNATNKAIERGECVDEESFGNLLWTAGMPDPDLVIRTSGELRTSGFLPWQSVYSELFFTDTYWPDFGEEEFKDILEGYKSRKIRKGV